MKFKTKYGFFRRFLFPFFYFSQIKSITPVLLLIIVGSIILKDKTLMLIMFSMWYILYVISMQRYIPYQIDISHNQIQNVINVLDDDERLIRNNKTLEWNKIVLFRFAISEFDQIRINVDGGSYHIIGDRKFLRSLCARLGD